MLQNIIKTGLFIAVAAFVFSCNQGGDTESRKEESEQSNTTHHQVIPIQDTSIQSYILDGYHSIWKEKGFLNNDSIEDVILVLAPNEEKTQSDFENGRPAKRIFYILIGKEEGGFEAKVKSDQVIECIDCSTLIGDAFKGINISNQQFEIQFEMMKEQF